MTTLQRPARQRRHAVRIVLAAVLVVAALGIVWVLGIVGWPGRTFDGAWPLRSAEVDGSVLTLAGSLVAALGRVDHAVREGDALTLTGPGVTLVFDPAAPGVLQE